MLLREIALHANSSSSGVTWKCFFVKNQHWLMFANAVAAYGASGRKQIRRNQFHLSVLSVQIVLLMEKVILITEPVWSLVHFRREQVRAQSRAAAKSPIAGHHAEIIAENRPVSETRQSRLDELWIRLTEEFRILIDSQAASTRIVIGNDNKSINWTHPFQPNAADESVLDQLGQELALRADLVREQWLARGPGLLAELERQASLVPAKTVVCQLLLPFVGGYGAVWGDNLAAVEAMLFDTSSQFPEMMRIAWLVATCWIRNQETSFGIISSSRESVYVAAAEATLRAADTVELVPYNQESLQELLDWMGISNIMAPCTTNGGLVGE